MKGQMTCVAASCVDACLFGWDITEDLTTIAFDAPRPIAANIMVAVATAIVADAGQEADAPDPYFFGKQIAALSPDCGQPARRRRQLPFGRA